MSFQFLMSFFWGSISGICTWTKIEVKNVQIGKIKEWFRGGIIGEESLGLREVDYYIIYSFSFVMWYSP